MHRLREGITAQINIGSDLMPDDPVELSPPIVVMASSTLSQKKGKCKFCSCDFVEVRSSPGAQQPFEMIAWGTGAHWPSKALIEA